MTSVLILTHFLQIILFTECELVSNVLLNQETKSDLQVGWVHSMSMGSADVPNLFPTGAILLSDFKHYYNTLLKVMLKMGQVSGLGHCF
jgi:hypothetical protein